MTVIARKLGQGTTRVSPPVRRTVSGESCVLLPAQPARSLARKGEKESRTRSRERRVSDTASDMSDQNDGWTHGAEWEEDRRGPADCTNRAANNLSFPEDGEFYKSTKGALPWAPAGRDDPGRVLVPATFVECLFEKAEVENAAEWIDTESDPKFRFLTRCLGLKEYMGDALEMLIEHGLTRSEDGELRVYNGEDPMTELYRKAAEVVMCVRDEEVMRVTEKSWDWTNAFEEQGAGARLECAHKLTLRALVEKTGDLTLYCDLAKKVGPRGTTEGCNDSSFCLAVLGEAGLLFKAIKTFYGHDDGARSRALEPGPTRCAQGRRKRLKRDVK